MVGLGLMKDFFFSHDSSNDINQQANQWSALMILALALLIKNLEHHVESSRVGGKSLTSLVLS